MAAVLDKDQLTFPDNPTVWLMDLATFINCSFDNIPEPDPVFENKPRGRVGYIPAFACCFGLQIMFVSPFVCVEIFLAVYIFGFLHF